MKIIVSLLLNSLALIITAYIVPGFKVADFTSAVLAAIVLGVINTFIKPVFVFLTLPINILTLGLFTFVVNAVMLWLTSLVVKGLTIENAMTAILAAIVLSVISTALNMLAGDLGSGKKRK